MHIAYCDESQDPKRTVSSAVVVPDKVWRDAFDVIRDFRKALSRKYSIPVQYELHARNLVGGKGTPGQRSKQLGRALGCTIFLEAIDTLNTLGATLGVYGINVSLPNSGLRHPLRETATRLFQRFENNLKKGTAGELGLIIYDGQQAQHRTMAHRLLRRMQIYNPIPSMSTAGFAPGSYRMMPIRSILGDPFIRDSSQDVFIQMADIMAYALLRKDNPPTHPVSIQYGIHHAFDRLPNVWLTAASMHDSQGVVRG